VEQLNQAGHEAYLVGGCVRDLLLGREPKDYDIATAATPKQVQGIFPQTVAVGRSFGVIMVIHKSKEYDVATFRKDIDYSDGRRPGSVSFCSVREDVLRRDFTVNGLLYAHEPGEVVDYVGGLQDLDAKIIRAIGEPSRRFEEDHLRVLRALRFSAELKFKIESDTYSAVQQNTPKLVRISRERVRDEFVKMLSLSWFSETLGLLRDSGVSEHLLPSWHRRVDASGDWAHFEARFDSLARIGLPPSPQLHLAALLLPKSGQPFGGAEEIEGDLKLLKLSRHQEKWVLEGVLLASSVRRDLSAGLSRHQLIRMSRRVAALEGVGLAWAESRIDGGDDSDRLEALFHECESFGEDDLYPEPLIRGDELMAAGIPPGPLLGTVVRRLEAAQLDGEIKDRESALQFALAIYREKDGEG